MDKETIALIAAIAAIIAAFVTGIVNLVMFFLKGHWDRKQANIRLACEMGLARWNGQIEMAKINLPQKTIVEPLPCYIAYFMAMMDRSRIGTEEETIKLLIDCEKFGTRVGEEIRRKEHYKAKAEA